jgi:hypothetical protein
VDEELLEQALGGPCEPGFVGYLGPGAGGQRVSMEVSTAFPTAAVAMDELPTQWRSSIPSSADLAGESIRLVPKSSLTVDSRFERRHALEYAMFKTVEEFHLLPAITAGFSDVSAYLSLAQTTLQRRKARAGRSIEHQLAAIFDEEGILYSAQIETEPGSKPDFVFPSGNDYQSRPVGDASLDMLASKSTLRDRWHHVRTEAAKIPRKHLFTLDEGVSEAQFHEIRAAGIQLVTPAGRVRRFSGVTRRNLITLGSFVEYRRAKQRLRFS